MSRLLRITVLALVCLPAAAQQTPPAPSPSSGGSPQELPDAPSARRKPHPARVTAKAEPASKPELTADSPHEPLSDRQKFDRFLDHTVSPFTFVSAMYNATWLQINGEPYSYGGGVNGWMKRFGVQMIGTETRSFFSQYFFPVILNQDPRYIPKRKGNFLARGWYAGTRVLVGRSDAGKQVFNSSYLLSVAASGALANAYAPADRRDFETTMLRIVGAYGSDAGSLVLEEFWPDIVRLFHRRAPKRIKDIQEQIQEKIPSQLLGNPAEPENSTPSEDPGTPKPLPNAN